MSVALRTGAQFQGFTASTTGTTVTAPTTIVNGDTLVIAMFIYNNASGSVPTPTVPSGWNVFTTSPTIPVTLTNSAGDGAKCYVWYKIAASESGNYSFTWTSTANTSTSWWAGSYSGADPSTPVTVTGTTNHGTGSSSSTGAVTTTVDQSMVVFVGWDWADTGATYSATNIGTPPTYTLIQSTTNQNLMLAEGVMSPAGATHAPSSVPNDSNGSDAWAAALVVINAASSGAVSIPDLIMAPPHR